MVSREGGGRQIKDVHRVGGSKEKQKKADKGGRGSKIPEILRTSFMNGPKRNGNRRALAGNFAAGQVGNKEGRHRRSLAYLSVEADKSRMQGRISSSDSFSFPLSVFFVCSGVKNGKCNTTLTGVQGRQSGMQRPSTDFQNAAL